MNLEFDSKIMSKHNSHDEVVDLMHQLAADVQSSLAEYYDLHSLHLDLKTVEARVKNEGISFLTKRLPLLGKALDKALSSEDPLDVSATGFQTRDGSAIPLFMGKLFERIFDSTGKVLPSACAQSVKHLRQFLYILYKYQLDYAPDQVHEVITKFERTEEDLRHWQDALHTLEVCTLTAISNHTPIAKCDRQVQIVLEARSLLYRTLLHFDPYDIKPKHGPGATAEKHSPWDKYKFAVVPDRLAEHYPIDKYFVANVNALLPYTVPPSNVKQLDLLMGGLEKQVEPYARVILVPKDSRGPRLISAEPTSFQWIQQGIMRELVAHIEQHPLTRENVRFTDQLPNQRAALIGSTDGRFATLDLAEASDRVSVDLVRLLFPKRHYDAFMACRSSATRLPDGREIKLLKFAPMGSALCFPVLALTIWSILTAGIRTRICDLTGEWDADRNPLAQSVCSYIYVYGDDVIVPAAFAEYAIELLESFGLKVNRDKSCTKGLFRESCGMDAFKGVDVTPLRLRKVWSSSRHAERYSAWISYANSMFDRRYHRSYWYVVDLLEGKYPGIPDDTTFPRSGGQEEDGNPVPCLRLSTSTHKLPKRWNQNYQKFECQCRSVVNTSVEHELDGWLMLHRYFTEKDSQVLPNDRESDWKITVFPVKRSDEEDTLSPSKLDWLIQPYRPFGVRLYTLRGRSELRRRWC